MNAGGSRSYLLEVLGFADTHAVRVCVHALKRVGERDAGGARVYVRELGEGGQREARICCGQCRGRGFLVGGLRAVISEHADAQAWEVAV